MARIRSSLGRISRTVLARNSAWVFGGQALRLGTRMVYFLIIARELGAANYGAFAAVLAFVAIAAPFSSWGAGNLLIRATAKDRSLFRVYWGNALLLVAGSSMGLLLLLFLLKSVFLPLVISNVLVLSIACAELIFTRLQEVAGQAFQAFERLKRTSQLWVLMGAARLLAAFVMMLVIRNPSPEALGLLYLSATGFVGAWSLILVHKELGLPRFDISRAVRELKDGFYFAVSYSASTVYGDVDKMMLASMAGLQVAGFYAAAYRLIEAAFTPIIALLHAAYPRFFIQGQTSLRKAATFGTRLMRISVIYASVAGIVLWLAAPVVPRLLGDDYLSAVQVLRWLALIPVLKSIHYFAADALSGSGHQGLRTAFQVTTALLNVVLNFVLIPAHSWRGAAWASLASDAFLAGSLWLSIRVLIHRTEATNGKVSVPS